MESEEGAQQVHMLKQQQLLTHAPLRCSVT